MKRWRNKACVEEELSMPCRAMPTRHRSASLTLSLLPPLFVWTVSGVRDLRVMCVYAYCIAEYGLSTLISMIFFFSTDMCGWKVRLFVVGAFGVSHFFRLVLF